MKGTQGYFNLEGSGSPRNPPEPSLNASDIAEIMWVWVKVKPPDQETTG